jgi:hypothetical protein
MDIVLKNCMQNLREDLPMLLFYSLLHRLVSEIDGRGLCLIVVILLFFLGPSLLLPLWLQVVQYLEPPLVPSQ